LEDRGAGAVLQRVLEKGSAKDKQSANQLQTQVMTAQSKGKELERSVCRR
jgi:hypothetical protein